MTQQMQLEILSLALPVVASLVVTLCIAGYKVAMSRLPANQRDAIAEIVGRAVRAVEFLAEKEGLHGAAKKALAEQMIAGALAGLHIAAPPALIDLMIESVVAAINEEQEATRAANGKDGTAAAPATVGFAPVTPTVPVQHAPAA